MRYLAIDYGQRRTGIAICDPMEILASPLVVLDRPDTLMADLLALIKQESVEALVVGLPINMDGSEGFQAKAVRKFADCLSEKVDLPLSFQDERLSSFGAKEKLKQAQGKRGRKRTQAIDAMAAAEILTAFLEAKHAMSDGDMDD